MTYRKIPSELTADRLCVSPHNVRLCTEDAEDTEWLENSIAGLGLIYPLLVHPLGDGMFGAIDGGRRYRAIRALVESGRKPADWPVRCEVIEGASDAELTQLSLTAAMLPRELRAWEIDAGIVRAHAQGDSVAEIAEAIGQPERWVARHLRLGRLAPEIFAAYAEGRIAGEQAQAYAATEDLDLQRAAWKHFGTLDRWQREPHHIRAWLKVDDRELAKLLRFVGEPAYRAAGGRFELDLFADGPDEERGRVVDEATLRELVENKLGHVRQNLRLMTGRSDLRFVSEAPKRQGFPDHGLAFEPKLERAKIHLPEGDVVCLIDVQPSGEAKARWFWASRKARADAERAARADGGDAPARVVTGHAIAWAEALHKQSHYAQAARQAVKDEHGLTADGLQVLRSLRRELLRAVMITDALGDGTLGRDYLIWSQLRQELHRDTGAGEAGTRALATTWHSEDTEPREIVEPHLKQTAAHALWTSIVDELRAAPFIALADPADAFAAFHFANDKLKATAGAVLAGLALVRSANAPGWRVACHDRVAELAGADAMVLRELWQPTPAFLALIPKLKRLELAQPFVDPAAFADWHKLGDQVLTGAVAGALQEARHWVHPLLRFPRSEDPADAAAEREMAK